MENKIQIRNENEIELTDQELVQTALSHLMQASGFLAAAGFENTSVSLMSFAYKAMEALSEEENTGDLKLVQDKLSKEEYDVILNDILAIDI